MAEDLITNIMTEAVINPFKAVEVEHEQGKVSGGGEGGGQGGFKRPAIGDAGQRISGGERFELGDAAFKVCNLRSEQGVGTIVIGDNLRNVGAKIAHMAGESFPKDFQVRSSRKCFEILAEVFEAGGGSMGLTFGIFGGAGEDSDEFTDRGQVVSARGLSILSEGLEHFRPRLHGGRDSRRGGVDLEKDLA